ncbi:hypothetical protein ACFO5R_08270 [Halosolutus amylolyticus]|uniref:DUF7344 domain-containing protein n=1 Tax=Halosolutus amylolyticus TaxID=2932267 RepID=A0ABD5PPC2_9EURY|nr:hypothetical protein [Halosolutus amylolyticus]
MKSASVSHLVGDSADDASTLSQEVAFEMLSCRRRRYVIHCLKQRGGAVELRDLVTQVAAWENEVAPEVVTYEQRMRVYTALRQSHLPKLDDGGIVTFEEHRGTIALTDAAAELEVYLDVVPHEDIPWSKYYAGLGILSLGFVGTLWIGLPPFSFVAPLGGALLVTLLFTISAAFHVRYDRRMRLGGDSEPPVAEVEP